MPMRRHAAHALPLLAALWFLAACVVVQTPAPVPPAVAPTPTFPISFTTEEPTATPSPVAENPVAPPTGLGVGSAALQQAFAALGFQFQPAATGPGNAPILIGVTGDYRMTVQLAGHPDNVGWLALVIWIPEGAPIADYYATLPVIETLLALAVPNWPEQEAWLQANLEARFGPMQSEGVVDFAFGSHHFADISLDLGTGAGPQSGMTYRTISLSIEQSGWREALPGFPLPTSTPTATPLPTPIATPVDEVAFWDAFPRPRDAEMVPVAEGVDTGFATALPILQVLTTYANWLQIQGWQSLPPPRDADTYPVIVRRWQQPATGWTLTLEIRGLDAQTRTVVWLALQTE